MKESFDGHIVSLRDMSFRYSAAATIFESFSLQIEQSSITAIMGPSGSGKTTLGRLIAGLLPLHHGTRECSEAVARHCDIVYIDQHPMNSVFPWQTTRRNLEYPLQRLGSTRSQAESRADDLLARFGLDELERSLPRQLSGGQLQRLALSRALSWNPRLVVLDETFSALDPPTREGVRGRVVELAKEEGVTLLIITHNISDVLAIATRCVVLAGRPARAVRDLPINDGRPGESTPDIVARAEEVLLDSIREGLI